MARAVQLMSRSLIVRRLKNGKDNTIIIGKLDVKTMRFNTWVEQAKDFNIEDYDTLVLDTQGNEMEILKGMGKYLKYFKFLSIELSETPVYHGETPARDAITWLDERGFIQDSPIQSHNDVFFVRSDIKSKSDLVYRGLG